MERLESQSHVNKTFVMAAFAFAALGMSCARAQSPKSNWDNLNGLPPGAEIRVFLAGGKTVRGFLQKADADSLAITATTSQERLPRQDVKRIQLKRQGHRGRNTLIGLGVGAAAGLGAWVSAARPNVAPRAQKAQATMFRRKPILFRRGSFIAMLSTTIWPGYSSLHVSLGRPK